MIHHLSQFHILYSDGYEAGTPSDDFHKKVIFNRGHVSLKIISAQMKFVSHLPSHTCCGDIWKGVLKTSHRDFRHSAILNSSAVMSYGHHTLPMIILALFKAVTTSFSISLILVLVLLFPKYAMGLKNAVRVSKWFGSQLAAVSTPKSVHNCTFNAFWVTSFCSRSDSSCITSLYVTDRMQLCSIQSYAHKLLSSEFLIRSVHLFGNNSFTVQCTWGTITFPLRLLLPAVWSSLSTPSSFLATVTCWQLSPRSHRLSLCPRPFSVHFNLLAFRPLDW